MTQVPDSFVNRIFNLDAIIGMKKLPDNCIPLTVTSPPYDQLRAFGGVTWNDATFQRIADELWRITAPGGVVVWIVADTIVKGSETCTSARQKLHFRDLGFRIHHTMIIDRAGSRFPSKVRYGTSLEYAFILSKGKPRAINLLKDRLNKRVGETQNFSRREPDGSIRPMSLSKPVAKFGYRRAIWQVSTGWNQSTKDDYAFEHPALMHEGVAKDHILSWSRPGDLVFDPMMGAATTTKMALLHNRRYLGFEIYKRYFRLAQRRMREARVEYDSGLGEWLKGA
jgi:site-specific DNA-methyltransferase (adenine-specific)